MMELWNSLGCKMCKKPLEACESVNKTNTRKPGRATDFKQGNTLVKFEGTFRQQLQQGARAEDIDPQPVAARCGHIFHRGCIKKLTTELNSSCIECPTCLKPIVLTQAWPIEFYHPKKDSKRPTSLPAKVTMMNEKNDSLQDKITQVRKLKAHKEAECREAMGAISTVKQSILLRRQELDDKLVELFGTPTLDERYEENVMFEKETILQRVKDLTNRNSQLLASIEERAKSHYVNEGENVKDDSCLQSSHHKNSFQREQQKQDREKLEKEPTVHSQILVKPIQVTRPNHDPEKLKDILKRVESGEMKMSGSGGDSFIPADNRDPGKNCVTTQEQPQPWDSDCKGTTPNPSCKFGPDSSLSSFHQELIPLATVTKSMQDLFEHEKLKYLCGKCGEKIGCCSHTDSGTMKTSSLNHTLPSHPHPHCHSQCSQSSSTDDSCDSDTDNLSSDGDTSSRANYQQVHNHGEIPPNYLNNPTWTPKPRSKSLLPAKEAQQGNPVNRVTLGSSCDCDLESLEARGGNLTILTYADAPPAESVLSETSLSRGPDAHKYFPSLSPCPGRVDRKDERHFDFDRHICRTTKPLASKPSKFQTCQTSCVGVNRGKCPLNFQSQSHDKISEPFPSIEQRIRSVREQDFKRQRWKKVPCEDPKL